MTRALDTPHAVATSTVRILGVDLSVSVLNTGERVIDAESMERLFAAFEQTEVTEADAVVLAKFIKGVE